MLRPEAVRFLRRVKRHVLAEPRRIAMGLWRWEKRDALEGAPAYIRRGYPACGTVACIGGWVETLHKREHPRSLKDAWKILGLSEEQGEELFMDDALMFAPNQQTMHHARAVARHIDAFVQKYAGAGETA